MAFLFASQNIPTGVIKYINSSCKMLLAHFICASYCSKEKKVALLFDRMTQQHEIFLSEGSFGSVVRARLLDRPYCSLKRR